jgi:TolB protein
MHRKTFFGVAALLTGLLLQPAVPAAAHPNKPHHAAEVIVWSRFVDLDFSAARIVLARPDGTHVRELTHSANGVVDIDPKVSPDGRRVVFERDLPDGSATIVVVRTDGSGEHALDLGCTDPCAADVTPTWTPDGRHIVFTRVVGPFDKVNDSATSAVLFVANLSGRHPTRLSPLGIDGVYEDYNASFAPAGYLVFTRVRNADIKSAVYRMDRNGATSRLTPWSVDADEASVSPARSGPTRDLVVFETFGHGPPDGVAQAVATTRARCHSADGCPGHIRYLTSPSSLPVQNFNPAWSPSGRRIAFVRFSFDPSAPPARGDIWTMTWKGTAKKAVTASPVFDFRPAWGRVER